MGAWGSDEIDGQRNGNPTERVVGARILSTSGTYLPELATFNPCELAA